MSVVRFHSWEQKYNNMNHKEALQELMNQYNKYGHLLNFDVNIAREALQSESEQPISPSIEKINQEAEDILCRLLWGRRGLKDYELHLRELTIKAMEEYAQLKANNHFEELEKWVKEEWFGCKEDDMTYHEHVVNADDLLNKIKELRDEEI